VDYADILYEKQGRVAVITFNRPQRLNAATPRMSSELRRAIVEANEDSAVGAVVITGAGRGFCAGADVEALREFRAALQAGKSLESQTPILGEDSWTAFLRRNAKPTIAAINGPAVGVGVSIVLPLDFRLMSETARIGFVFVNVGLAPETASSGLLPRIVGMGRAIDWYLSGRLVSAEEAREAGFASEVLRPDRLLPRARARGAARGPTTDIGAAHAPADLAERGRAGRIGGTPA
jgi:enoyl-CoA hydratase/carnithine racemase